MGFGGRHGFGCAAFVFGERRKEKRFNTEGAEEEHRGHREEVRKACARGEIVRTWGAGVLRPYGESAIRWRMRRRQKMSRSIPMRINERLRPTHRPSAPQWRRKQSQAPSGKPISQ